MKIDKLVDLTISLVNKDIQDMAIDYVLDEEDSHIPLEFEELVPVQYIELDDKLRGVTNKGVTEIILSTINSEDAFLYTDKLCEDLGIVGKARDKVILHVKQNYSHYPTLTPMGYIGDKIICLK